ncbi:hypothetical protein [Desulfobacula toluolica]|nr:hypothetical protein [Desulfobacula toluolica]
MIDNHKKEPLSVSGLGILTSSQQALADFLEVDPDLLKGAGINSPADQTDEISESEVEDWIDGLPKSEVNTFIKQLLQGKGHQAERKLKNWFATWRINLQGDKPQTPRRTLGELLKNAKKAEKIRLDLESLEQMQQEIKRRKEREVYLKNISKDFPKIWKSVQQIVKRGSGLAYDEACRSILDISEAYSLIGNSRSFRQELNKFMTSHMRRRALIQRLAKVGIWEEK